MPVPFTFATATSAIPLSQLDSNFATAITIGNTAVQLGNTITTINNLTLANVTITSGTSNTTIAANSVTNAMLVNSNVVIGNTTATLGTTVSSIGNLTLTNVTISNVATTFPNNFLANSTATLGNTTITLGSTTSSVGNLTLANTTVTNYTETLYTATGNVSISLSNGTIQKITTAGTTTITLPASVSGKSFTIIVSYAAADALVWAGGSTLKWANSTTPTATSATGKFDIFNFYQDGTNTYGSIFGQNY
jgi:hypothetical protein